MTMALPAGPVAAAGIIPPVLAAPVTHRRRALRRAIKAAREPHLDTAREEAEALQRQEQTASPEV